MYIITLRNKYEIKPRQFSYMKVSMNLGLLVCELSWRTEGFLWRGVHKSICKAICEFSDAEHLIKHILLRKKMNRESK